MNKPAKYNQQALKQILRGSLFLIIIGLLLFGFLVDGSRVVAQSEAIPENPPDALAGLPVHAERCANCHGPTGKGDGELAANLPNPPIAHGSTEYLRTAVPANMFDVATNGRIPRGMPPFGPESSDPLTDAERWDVIAAIYTFGTPVESLEAGQNLYEENCLSCHGETGLGDGPEAATSDADPGDLSDLNYWFLTSNQAVYDKLADGQAISAHTFDLAEEDIWSVVDYIRTFSYGYTDSLAAFRPLEEATVGGQVLNGTTEEPLTNGATALLRAFTTDLDITLTMTETVAADGTYHFDLTDVPQDWFFRVSVDYEGVDFGSDFGQVTFDRPGLDLPVTVYDKGTDPSALSLEQVHVVLVFDQGQLIVSELYVVSNNAPTIYVGETGDEANGTFEFQVPDGAEQLSIQRGFGSIDSFIPANEVVPTESGFADTLPVRPGPGTLTLLAQYALPYDRGATISHPLEYDTAGVNLVIPDAGVELVEGDGWVNTGSQSMEAGQVTTYGQANFPAGGDLTITLEGRARSTGAGATVDLANNTLELVIGGVVALAVVVGAVVLVQRWRLESEEEELSREDLLQEIADLDDAYETGEIDEGEYHRLRDELKDQLMAIWEEGS